MSSEGTARHSLSFYMEGSDVGNNTIRMTQKRINLNLFSDTDSLYDFLSRTIIWTQRNHPRFLDSSDTSSKNEIAKLVDIDLWMNIWMICLDNYSNVSLLILAWI